MYYFYLQKNETNGFGFLFVGSLTLFLHVTWIRYFVSGHNDSSTLDDWVNRLPINPPPDTSHVTKQSLGDFVVVHAIFVDTNELSRTIDCTDNDHVSKMDLFMLVDAVHSSQHCKEKARIKKDSLAIGFRDKNSRFYILNEYTRKTNKNTNKKSNTKQHGIK